MINLDFKKTIKQFKFLEEVVSNAEEANKILELKRKYTQ